MESYPYMILDQDYWLWVVTRILGEKESLIDQKFFILHSFVFQSVLSGSFGSTFA